jgi:hypothetical protein
MKIKQPIKSFWKLNLCLRAIDKTMFFLNTYCDQIKDLESASKKLFLISANIRLESSILK